MISSNLIKPLEHLNELYHDLPKFANDPAESPIIKTYDLLLKRFQGIYGRQPTYFIRSPVSAYFLGADESSVELSSVSFCSSQNVIIAVALNGHQQIRVNNFQNAMFGEKVFQADMSSLKYGSISEEEEYSLLLTICLKTFSTLNNMQSLSGLDILIYDDFIQDNYLHSKQALCFGLYCCFHFSLRPKVDLKKEMLQKFMQKVKGIKTDIRNIRLPLVCTHSNFTVAFHQQAQLKESAFPKDLSFVIAHSMTPLPKKLIKGKRENLRNCQILIGIEIIKSQIGANSQIKSLKQLQNYLDCNTLELIDSVEEYLPKGNLSPQKIQQLTEKSLIDILREVPFANNVIDENLSFNPYNRIMFYLKEEMLISKLMPENTVQILKESFSNSVNLLEIGSEQIEQMIQIVQGLCLGWKIIGNGWGGNVLFLCKSSHADKLVEELTNEFYMNPQNKILLSDDIEQYVKVVKGPATGLSVLNPESQIWY